MPKSKRVSISILSTTRGGVLTYSKNLVKEVSKRGLKVNVFFISRSDEVQKNDFGQDISFLTLFKHIPNPMTLLKLFRSKPNLIHANFATLGVLAVLMKFVIKTPFVLSLHGSPQPWLNRKIADKIKYLLEKRLLHFVGSHASAIITVSNYAKESLMLNFGLRSEVIYHGISLTSIKPFSKKWAKEKIGFKAENFVVLFVGTLNPCKDPVTLIKGIHYASRKSVDMRLIMVGTGELCRDVRNETKILELEDYIKFIEYATEEQLRLYYSAADLFVLPSVTEAFGIVLLEAMAFGLPIIASKSGAIPEVIGKTGILFNQGDHKELGEKILKILIDQKLREKMATFGSKRVAQVFSLEEHVAKHMNLYKRILSSIN